MLKKAFFSLLIVSAVFADDSDCALTLLSEKAKIHELRFDSLLTTAQEPLLPKLGEDLSEKLKAYGTYIGVPLLQQEEWIDGALCHVSYYSDAVITTVLTGPYYGLQLTSDYRGNLLIVNPYYTLERNFSGIFLRHEYPDCTIITGKNQAIFSKY